MAVTQKEFSIFSKSTQTLHYHFPGITCDILKAIGEEVHQGRLRLLILTLYLPSLDWVHVQKAETCQKSMHLHRISKLLLVCCMQISFLFVLIYLYLGNSPLKIIAIDEYRMSAVLGTLKMLSCISNLKFFISN